MNVTAKEFLKLTGPDDSLSVAAKMVYVRPRALCDDGFSVSIQASNTAYCTPRRWDCDNYVDVELGFPLKPDPIIEDYAEDIDDQQSTVYPFVPMNIVEDLIEFHGGIIGYIDIAKSIPVLFSQTCGPDGCGFA